MGGEVQSQSPQSAVSSHHVSTVWRFESAGVSSLSSTATSREQEQLIRSTGLQRGSWTGVWPPSFKMKPICLIVIFLQIAHYGTTQGGNVTFQVNPSPVLEGGILNLICKQKFYLIPWKKVYIFYKDNIKIHSMKTSSWTNEHQIKVNSSKDSGHYYCTANDKESQRVHVRVQELFPKPKLTTDPAVELFEGQQLKLACSVATHKSNLYFEYSFYKNGEALKLNSYNIYRHRESASLNDSGTYLCEANAVRKAVKKKSDVISISVKQAFSKPTLRAEPEAQIFEGQQLKLICLVDIFQSKSSLRYVFSKNGHALNGAVDQNNYILETAGLDDSGNYTCEATIFKSEVKKLSNQVFLSVRQIPVSKPELAIHPGKMILEGDTARLICSVSAGSPPITYIFYKFSNKTLYQEKSNLTRVTYGIGEMTKNKEGNYGCVVENEATEAPLQSEVVAVAVIVPVADAFIISNTNEIEVSAGDHLILQCLVKAGTAPYFRWYLNSQELQNTSESFQLNADGSELIINSFQRGQRGRYHCVATNRLTDEVVFNTTSNSIDFTAPDESYTTTITVLVLPLPLIASLILLIWFKRRSKKQDDSSRIPQQLGGATGNRSPSSIEETSAINFGHADVGSAQNNASVSDQATYCSVLGTEPTTDTKTTVNVVYSVVTVRNPTDNGNCGDVSGEKPDSKDVPNDDCVMYATLKHGMAEDSLEMEQDNVYENFPRK
ncbi:Fc receptor-like protein 5 [Heterodontus francisci]|uniref:Fc receptor-like protein 5 n=1 Tax=Heterodontus francisci TaxID=7792 RepID=UPI00355C9311